MMENVTWLVFTLQKICFCFMLDNYYKALLNIIILFFFRLGVFGQVSIFVIINILYSVL